MSDSVWAASRLPRWTTFWSSSWWAPADASRLTFTCRCRADPTRCCGECGAGIRGGAYRERALEIAALVPVLGLGADIITGFPGETDRDHQETRDLVDELPFTYLHVFPFSPRAGTVASPLKAEDGVPERIAAERSRDLRQLAAERTERYRASRAGDVDEVTLERRGERALTGDYLRIGVISDGRTVDPHRLHRGRLTRREGRSAY